MNKRVLELHIENSTGSYVVTVNHGELQDTLDIVLEKPGARPIPTAHYSNIGFVHALAAYPGEDRLVSVWEPGAFVVVVFRLAPPPSDQQELVFESVSESQPEFFDGGFAGRGMLLSSGKHFVDNSLWVPVDALVYVWNGHTYELVKTVPYKRRFEAVEGLR